MIANELTYTPEGNIDLFSDWRARRDERAYQLLNNVAAYVIIAHAAGQYPIEVVRAVQLDVMVAQLSGASDGGQMSRTSANEYRQGLLWNGYDYTRQAWVKDGKYVRCGHPENMQCPCYGRAHEGESIEQEDK